MKPVSARRTLDRVSGARPEADDRGLAHPTGLALLQWQQMCQTGDEVFRRPAKLVPRIAEELGFQARAEAGSGGGKMRKMTWILATIFAPNQENGAEIRAPAKIRAGQNLTCLDSRRIHATRL